MFKLNRLHVTLALALILTSTALNRADDTPAASQPAKNYTVLTNDSLGKMLDQMGYSPSKLSKGYLIAIKRETWTFNIQLVLSADGTKLGFNSNLGKVDDPGSVTAEQWKALMIANGDIDPSAFYFDKDQKKLYLHRVMDNRAIDPAILRSQIDSFCGNLKDTADLWTFTK